MEIRISNLKYNDIINATDIEIKDGVITSLIGKNGSGKTCFLNLIYGMDLNFDGDIGIGKNVLNKNINKSKINKLRENASYLRQDYSEDLFNSNTLIDIEYGLKNIDKDSFNELLKMFDLSSDILNRNYIDLSSSEKKKILIVRCFLKDSKVILLDDPTNGLDQKGKSNLIKILKREKRNKKVIIVASLDTEFLLKISDDFLIFENGKIYQKNGKYETLSDKALLNKYNMDVPNTIQIKMKAYDRKKIKLVYRENINDLLKDIYRNAEKK